MRGLQELVYEAAKNRDKNNPLHNLVIGLDSGLRELEAKAPDYEKISEVIIKGLEQKLNIFIDVPQASSEKAYQDFKNNLVNLVKDAKALGPLTNRGRGVKVINVKSEGNIPVWSHGVVDCSCSSTCVVFDKYKTEGRVTFGDSNSLRQAGAKAPVIKDVEKIVSETCSTVESCYVLENYEVLAEKAVKYAYQQLKSAGFPKNQVIQFLAERVSNCQQYLAGVG